jgi:hypothetical protein
MPSNEEARVLRLEADLARLETLLAADEARAAQLEQSRPAPPSSGAAPPSFPVVLAFNMQVQVTGLPAGNWASVTLNVFDGSGTFIEAVTTDPWGYISGFLTLASSEIGQVYTSYLAYSGRPNVTLPAVTIGPGWNFIGTPYTTYYSFSI